MKTFFKNNMIAVFALLLSIGTMSFKLSEKSNSVVSHWYERNDDGSYSPVGEPDASCTEIDNDKICALGFNSAQASVDDSMRWSAPGVRFKPN